MHLEEEENRTPDEDELQDPPQMATKTAIWWMLVNYNAGGDTSRMLREEEEGGDGRKTFKVFRWHRLSNTNRNIKNLLIGVFNIHESLIRRHNRQSACYHSMKHFSQMERKMGR